MFTRRVKSGKQDGHAHTRVLKKLSRLALNIYSIAEKQSNVSARNAARPLFYNENCSYAVKY